MPNDFSKTCTDGDIGQPSFDDLVCDLVQRSLGAIVTEGTQRRLRTASMTIRASLIAL